jgi:hypothetical protein
MCITMHTLVAILSQINPVHATPSCLSLPEISFPRAKPRGDIPSLGSVIPTSCAIPKPFVTHVFLRRDVGTTPKPESSPAVRLHLQLL